MRLIFTSLALLGGAALISALIADARPWRTRFSMSMAAVAVAIAAALIGANIWTSVEGFQNRAEATSGVTYGQATVAGGSALGQNTAFLDWARTRIPEDATFYFYPVGPASDSTNYQWGTYQLGPRISVDDPDRADWLVFYGVDPRETNYDRLNFNAPVRFGPEFEVAERRAR